MRVFYNNNKKTPNYIMDSFLNLIIKNPHHFIKNFYFQQQLDNLDDGFIQPILSFFIENEKQIDFSNEHIQETLIRILNKFEEKSKEIPFEFLNFLKILLKAIIS